MVGGAFVVTVVVFSFASGIFHPYYVSFLAPFAAALVGAGVGLMLPASFGGVGRARTARVLAPLAIAGGAVTELVVLGEIGGALSWAAPLVIASAAPARSRSRSDCPAACTRRAGRAGARRTAGGARDLGGRDARPRDELDLPDRRPGKRVGRGPRRIRRPLPAAAVPARRRLRRRAARPAGSPAGPPSGGFGGRSIGRRSGPGRRRLRRQQHHPDGGGPVRERARWRHNRRLQPEQRGHGDPLLRRERRRARRASRAARARSPRAGSPAR